MVKPLVSIVILSWNRKDEIKNSVASAFDQTYKKIEVIVVDNNSTDGSREMLENSGLGIRLVKLDKNVGVAGGRNVGIKVAKGEFIFFLDDDAVISTIDGIESLVNKMCDDSKIGVICCKIINYYTKETENFYFKYVDRDNINREFYVTDFSGGASFLRRSVLDRIGCYREDSLRQAEETDLSYRILDKGYHILYCPKVIVLHKVSRTPKSDYDIFYYNMKNSLLIAWRYLPLSRAILFTAWNIVVDFIRAIKMNKIPCYFKAYLDALFCLPGTIFKSRNVINKKTLGEIDFLKRHVTSDSGKFEGIESLNVLQYIIWEIKSRFLQKGKSA